MKTSAWTILISGALLFGTAFSQDAPQDLKLTVRHTFGEYTSTSTEYFSGQNSRAETQLYSGKTLGHHRAIVRLRGPDKIQVYDLDLDSQEFASYQTNLNGATAHPKAVKARPSGKTFIIESETVDTGERKEIFGQTARHLITREKRIGGPENCYGGNSEYKMDGWYIDYDVLPFWRRQREAGLVTTNLPLLHGDGFCYDKLVVHRTGPPIGFAMRLKTTSKSEFQQPDKTWRTYTGGSELEIVEFSRAPLDPALFQVPADFRKVDKIIDPTQWQEMSYWQRIKETLYSWIR